LSQSTTVAQVKETGRKSDFRKSNHHQTQALNVQTPTIKRETKPGFSSINWRIHQSRFFELRNFLEEYNLIGMGREKVEDLLGVPDHNGAYTLSQGFCANGYEAMEIVYDNSEKVRAWHIFGFNWTDPWIDQNVIVKTVVPLKFERKTSKKK